MTVEDCRVAGMWAQSVQHPSAGITKEYIVTCSAEPTRRQLETIAGGCEVDGAYVTPVAVAPVKDVGQKDRLRIVVAEGRNREVLTPSCAQLCLFLVHSRSPVSPSHETAVAAEPTAGSLAFVQGVEPNSAVLGLKNFPWLS